ncbi:MAG: carbon-nitrogen hydrolase family protein [Pseudomonadota bacterium]
MKAGLIQITASDDPVANLPVTEALIREAAANGADIAFTPEVTNIVSASRTRQKEMLATEAEDRTLDALQMLAADLGIWISIGSLALLSGDDDGRFVNRQFLIAGDGRVVAKYDKIHMFDVELGGEESYRESKGYRPGNEAVIAETPWGRFGLTTCYDMRFPSLYRALAEAGAKVLTAPSAFTVPTGKAHWHVLLRARAVETGSFVIASAQWGTHAAVRGRVRQTYGHSLVVNPWGEVIADAGEGTGVTMVDIDLEEADASRRKIPALMNAREFSAPRL